jgi:hypothetical protein
MKKLIILTSVCALFSASIGLFYSFGGPNRVVTNIYGQEVTLYGDGIYANDSIMTVGATKGTDIVILAAASLLLLLTLLKQRGSLIMLQGGLLALILYATTCLIMGVSYNRLFLLYALQFGSALFAFIIATSSILKTRSFDTKLYTKRLTGTAIFLIIGGCSVLVWLIFIIPPTFTGQPLEIIEVYTTVPTFALDLAIIFPSALFCGLSLLKKRPAGYQLAPVFLTLLTGVGITVIMQTIVQSSLGVVLNIGQLFGLVVSFIVLGAVALVLNIKLLKLVR